MIKYTASRKNAIYCIFNAKIQLNKTYLQVHAVFAIFYETYL